MSGVAKKLVMVVDDDHQLARAVQRILEWQFEAETFFNGDDAFEALMKKPYDAIICDVNMGGMSGPELLLKIQRHLPDLVPRFVFHTASVEPHSLKLFNVPILLKPSKASDMIAMVNRVIQV